MISNPFQCSIRLAALYAFLSCATVQLSANIYTIEPDDYTDGMVLNNVHPLVDLAIHDGISTPDFPDDFGVLPDPNVIPVTALENEDIFGGYFTSTGTKSFGHSQIDFTPLSRSIGMSFNSSIQSVQIDVIGSTDLEDTVGVLEVYTLTGVLLESVQSPGLSRQQVATLSITRNAADIGFARAYSSDQHSPFGRFDHLRFSTVPEPNGIWTAVLIMLVLVMRVRHQLRRYC